MPIAYRHEAPVEYGIAKTVSPLLRRIVAHNPGPFTYYGTGTYVIGRGNVAIVDPGPDLPEHVDALLAALPGETITHQLITHTHNDHSPAARLLKERTGARTHGFGPHGEGRYERGADVEAGADLRFVPDVKLRDGDVIEGDGWSVQSVHTPGHCSNHLCFALREERALLSGDHVMGWSTTIVSPPDGDMAHYKQSLARLLERDDAVYFPTHGAPIPDPKPFVRAILEHREQRESQVIANIAKGVDTIAAMVPLMYEGLPVFMHGAAARSVFAHVIELCDRGILRCEAEPSLSARYALV